MAVGKRKSVIAGDGDRGCQRWQNLSASGAVQGPGEVKDALQRPWIAHPQCSGLDEGVKRAVLLRLHQPEVAGGPAQCLVIAKRQQHLVAQRLAQQQFMALAGGAVEDHACQVQVFAITRETMYQRRRRLGLVAAIQREQHRQSEHHREVSRRALRPARAVKQAHDAFDDQEVRVARQFCYQPLDLAWRHRPGIEVVAGPPGGRLVEARIDVVRAHLGRCHTHSTVSEGSQKSQRYQRLAAAGRRRGDDDGLSQPGSPAGAPCTSRAGSSSRRRGPPPRSPGSAARWHSRSRPPRPAWWRRPADAAWRRWKRW